jgi:hypothetical protein
MSDKGNSQFHKTSERSSHPLPGLGSGGHGYEKGRPSNSTAKIPTGGGKVGSAPAGYAEIHGTSFPKLKYC